MLIEYPAQENNSERIISSEVPASKRKSTDSNKDIYSKFKDGLMNSHVSE